MSNRAKCQGTTKAGKPCSSALVSADTGFCFVHDPERKREAEAAATKARETLADLRTEGAVCWFPGCDIPVSGRRWCSDTHRIAMERVRKAANRPTPNVGTISRGRYYERILSEGTADLLLSGELAVADVARDYGTSPAVLQRSLNAVIADRAVALVQSKWTPGGNELPPLTEDTIDLWVEAFIDFRNTYFRLPTGGPFVTTDYMRRWISAIFYALATGGRQLILSPPRHGKTEMLMHLAVFLICEMPNIQIMWVGKSENRAKLSVRAIMDIFSNTEELATAYCGPHGSFRPTKDSGREWSPSGGSFTVATRNATGLKSPTMVALGRGGDALSRDADLIICDDIEDHRSTSQPSSREATRNWWQVTMESRKQHHTAWLTIGSRQHVDDLYNYLLVDSEWECIVEEAHALDCDLPEDKPDLHIDCMMWPEKNPYAWLIGKFRTAEAAGQRDLAEMVYLNRPLQTALQMFSGAKIDPCKNPSRTVRMIPPGFSLIGGLDPSATGYQAAFIWGYRIEDRLDMAMVDIENRQGGGIRAARDTIRFFYEKMRVAHWVIEDNLYRGGISDDDKLRDYCATHGIHLESHHTGSNKWDPVLGVTALDPLFANQQIDLPYADGESQEKTDLYRSQLIHFTTDQSYLRGTRNRRVQSDLVMASWFPLKAIRRSLQQLLGDVVVEYDQSYAWMNGTDWSSAPW